MHWDSRLPLKLCLAFVGAAAAACGRGAPKAPDGPPHGAARGRAPAPKPDPDALPEATGLPPEARAFQVVAGRDRWVAADLARERGLVLVDLSDDWAPLIFQDGASPEGAVLPNRYRAIFVGLAGDRTDGDGRALAPGQKNLLELYGIPPSLSVMRRRFLEDAGRTCEAAVDTAKLLAVDGITTWGATTERKEFARARQRAERLEKERQAAGVETLDELAIAAPKLAKDIAAHARFGAERAAFAEVEKRLVCEGLMDPAKHRPGSYDAFMRVAVLDFQQKNAVMAQGDLTTATIEALARPMLVNNFYALGRALTERAAHAGAFLEDGSVNPPSGPRKARKVATFLSLAGDRVPVPDLVGQARDALMARLGLSTPDEALAFFRRRSAGDFRRLRAAVRLPTPPEYYGPHMDLFAEIDRGDIWYDFPFDAAGKRLPQPRRRFPSFTLFVRWRGERVPLVRWRTTIGGWRSELASDGQEYYRFKESDVGPRLWRHVVAAPVWIPPPSSPLGSMVKAKWVGGAVTKVVNHDETGPGYLSAYGLVAAIHVQPVRSRGQVVGYFDNGIRTHGSFDYMSLRGRFSHGCHRLYNNLAVRLFSFVLGHRRHRTQGSVVLDFRRTFWSDGEVFEMRLPTRGFTFELDPALPVETLEGESKGMVPKSIATYIRKPGVVYAGGTLPPVHGDPESKAGGGAAPPEGETEP